MIERDFLRKLGRWTGSGNNYLVSLGPVHRFRSRRLEEYEVSVFAQELGTAQSASPKRLDELRERIRAAE